MISDIDIFKLAHDRDSNFFLKYRYIAIIKHLSRPERKEKAVLFRIPEFYLIMLDGIVKHSKGKFKSRNDLVIEILHNFYKSLDEEASSSRKMKSRRKKNG